MIHIRSAAMIVNARSRRGQAQFAEACKAMQGLPYKVDAHAVEDPDDLVPRLKQVLAAKPDLVVLGGGDGTISSLVDHLLGHDVILGVLPFGTANSFCRTLGIPLDIPGAVDVLRTGRPRRIDLGMVDGDYYANCAAIGISPLIAQTIPHGVKKLFGRAGYLSWAALQFARFQPFELTVTNGSHVQRLTATEVRISNGPYHGGTELVEEAQVDSGEIVVQVVCGKGKRSLVRNWAAGFFRLDSRRVDTVSFHGQSLRIETVPPLPISIDGEVLAKTPVTAKIAAGIIEVMAPA
ncbi:diacylglycerol kinase [Sphingomonas sp. Leaf407]|uniref:diacylglycerol/lipid kinase family protein n=1 Tax=unclassified Sphingomonas TaxID=196159 RepID=UPI0006FA08A5|nr:MULTISPECIES: diacylglycerol kinase family protein [unclassified Sphingomonas]KQN36944.1 diacylglycerol kinase [Sphingomonas sp. Leaf42]KQT30371.1 diacylglycerol kinase [Sphingomonas sp. Leaf407]